MKVSDQGDDATSMSWCWSVTVQHCTSTKPREDSYRGSQLARCAPLWQLTDFAECTLVSERVCKCIPGAMQSVLEELRGVVKMECNDPGIYVNGVFLVPLIVTVFEG